ncbi:MULTISPECIES: response regulator transcription factor [unclassified Variovorax]|uniref:response regulator transcription factor n=1 Tax=unclassified Variovorax TaxID=663243 RepID=UPI00076D6D68|nr:MULTISPECIES: response regulator transcription factor [unclassified Variovorax]KWT94124.1 two component transcriptional regulator, LuxR family [Variovorax sp. WDL1]PNG59917.1 Transcriptional regulatory protein DesR [Variovorax sp. B4]PNG60292.1 Transcriptional regulatory protein DesR [Variovorax sp. B2]VTV13864.1 Response regulator protein VraR [Variovorax sp. WDL1]
MSAQVHPSKINVAVTHQDTFVAAGIAALLRSRADFAVQVGEPGASGADVLVTDYTTGLQQATHRQRQRRGAVVGALIVTDQNTGVQIRRAVDAGVRGYVLQDCSAEQLSQAVRSVAAGRRYLGELVAEQLLDSLGFVVPTARELEVLQLIAFGMSNKEIGRRLGIGEGTVKTHVKAILVKLGEPTRTAALREARRRGLLSA